jgi:hypothetical protein
VVFAVQQGDALRVYVRNGDAELRQVAQTAVNVADVDPVHLVTLVADLDAQLGWSGPAAAGGRVLGHPAVAALAAQTAAAGPKKPKPTKPKAARPTPADRAGRTPEAVVGRAARFRQLLDAAPPEGYSRPELCRRLGYSPGADAVSVWVREGLAAGWLIVVNPGGGPHPQTFRSVDVAGPPPQPPTDDAATQRAALMVEITARHPEPVAAADLSHLFSQSEWRTGTMHNRLNYLVDHGLLIRTGEVGSYRWALAGAAEATG